MEAASADASFETTKTLTKEQSALVMPSRLLPIYKRVAGREIF